MDPDINGSIVFESAKISNEKKIIEKNLHGFKIRVLSLEDKMLLLEL
jgi:hypothetical protein